MEIMCWPSELPQVQDSDVKESVTSNIASFAVSQGPPKRRRKSTRNRVIQTFGLQITGEEVAILKGFYNTTLNGGIDTFTWQDAITDASASFRFNSEPEYKLIVPGATAAKRIYECSIELERMS